LDNGYLAEYYSVAAAYYVAVAHEFHPVNIAFQSEKLSWVAEPAQMNGWNSTADALEAAGDLGFGMAPEVIGHVTTGIAGFIGGGKNCLGEDSGLNFGLDDLYNNATGAKYKNGLSEAGRSLTKHGNRPGSSFPSLQGNPSTINETAANIVADILTSPNSTTTQRHHALYGPIIEIYAPDGRGLRYNGNSGEFMGFIQR
jgi:hypothetical protein